MIIDTHTHIAPWSVDGVQSIEELLSTAAKKNIDGVCITDHYDIDSITEDGRRWVFDPYDYHKAISKYRKKPSCKLEEYKAVTKLTGDKPDYKYADEKPDYKYADEKADCKYADEKPDCKYADGKPGALTGIEISFARNHLQEIHELCRNEVFDCVIMSLHDYNHIDPVTDTGALFDGSLEDVYTTLLEEMAYAMDEFSDSNICGHYDFFSRYAPVKAPKMLYSLAPKAFDHLFSVLIKNEQGLEINTGTVAYLHERFNYSIEDSMPDPEILKRYREMGGKVITLASDGHNTEDDGRYFKETLSWLKTQGINELFWMEERKWFSAGF